VLELQEQLTTTENQISFSRQHYNASVLDYNTSIQTFPNVLIAGPLGFHQARVLRGRSAGPVSAHGRPWLHPAAGGAAPHLRRSASARALDPVPDMSGNR
jgi:hypothetical protein